MLLVVARLPQAPDVITEAARATGLAPADVRSRLAGPLPRVLLTEPDPERARSFASALEILGFAVLICDSRAAPRDDDRLLARRLEWVGGDHLCVNTSNEREEVPGSSLILIQKGFRIETSTDVTKKSERRLDLTRALLTGGLLLTKKVETKSTKTATTRHAFLLLHRADGGRDVMIYEHQIDYRFLGTDLQPSRTANFDRLVARFRSWAPRVAYDDRVGRPGFVSGLPSTTVPPVDLGLWLVQLVHLRRIALPR
jgi:hypothetical protein